MPTGEIIGSKYPIEAHLDRIPVLASSPMLQTDALGRTVWVNAAFERLTGYTAQEAIGRTPGSLLQCAETDPTTILAIREALSSAKPIDIAVFNRSKNGRGYWLKLDIQPVFGPDQELLGFQATEIDITEIMEARASKGEALALAKSCDAIVANVAALTGVGTWEADLDRNGISWSAQAATILDLEPGATLQLEQYVSLFEPEVQVEVRAQIQASICDQSAFEFERPLQTQGGRHIWVRVVGRVLETEGQPRRLVGALQDVTQQRSEREALRTALEVAKIALSARTAYQDALHRYAIVAITDRRGDIILVNDGFCEISGYSREELIGRNHRILNSGAHPRGFFGALWSAISSGEAWHGEVCNRNKAGDLFWLDTTVVPLMGADGYPEQFVSVRYDITERKTAESQRYVILDTLNERSLAAEAATVAKSQFLATISHEIRTPMNGVIGMLDLLMKTKLDAQQTLRASTALDAARSLLVLLNDILDFSKLEGGQVTIESIAFSPRELLDQLSMQLSARAEAKGLVLNFSAGATTPALVRGDPTRIRQVLVNLIGNALKFTEDGVVSVEATYDADAVGEELRLEVRDTGIGLSPEQQALVFQRFVQADATTTRRFGGTGLGLAISKQLVELMGGELGVSSQIGVGSMFWATLGATEAAEPDAVAVQPLELVLCDRSLRILAADDHSINRMVVQMYLEAAGHVVTLVNNGAEALDAIKSAPFDIVLMDVQMPVMDGIAATKAIRALPYPLCDVPIIALTANAMAGDRERYLSQGMDDYVAKPIDAAALLSAVARLSHRDRQPMLN